MKLQILQLKQIVLSLGQQDNMCLNVYFEKRFSSSFNKRRARASNGSKKFNKEKKQRTLF